MQASCGNKSNICFFPTGMGPWSRSKASSSAHAAANARSHSRDCSATAFSQPHLGPDYHKSVLRVLSADRARWEIVAIALCAIATLPLSSKILVCTRKRFHSCSVQQTPSPHRWQAIHKTTLDNNKLPPSVVHVPSHGGGTNRGSHVKRENPGFLGFWAAPGGRETPQKRWGRSPPPF